MGNKENIIKQKMKITLSKRIILKQLKVNDQ